MRGGGEWLPFGKGGKRGISISHIEVFWRARLCKGTGNEIVISAQCPIICTDRLLGRTPVVQTSWQYCNKR